jgi:hypothetical protein
VKTLVDGRSGRPPNGDRFDTDREDAMTPTNEDFDAPAYTRDETSLPEIQRRLALWEADRVEARNRTLAQRLWSTMESEGGGAPKGIGLGRRARWVSGIMGQRKPGDSPHTF